jgi:uncharacterized protein YyaL (SSP411 family)
MDLLVYAAGQWKDEESLKILRGGLERVVRQAMTAPQIKEPHEAGGSAIRKIALWTRVVWDVYALTGVASLKRLAQELADSLSRSYFDEEAGAFRGGGDSRVFHGDENAIAAIAMWRSFAFTGDVLQKSMAEKALAHLSGAGYHADKGIYHRKDKEAGSGVWGLLDDNAWGVLAFSEAFLMTGHKPYREFADVLVKYLFQELWERERGGFTDRVFNPDDLALLKNKLTPYDLNAIAFEGVWRMHHLKGNQNYRKWMNWGFPNVAGAAEGYGGILLAKVQDLLAHGRSDLELVGRLDDQKTRDLLAAIHRLYLPRKIISFIEPDDQDYIMAHRLEAPSYPRLFVCKELKRVGDTEDPAKVASVMEALW